NRPDGPEVEEAVEADVARRCSRDGDRRRCGAGHRARWKATDRPAVREGLPRRLRAAPGPRARASLRSAQLPARADALRAWQDWWAAPRKSHRQRRLL